jgi:hypothetical protein
VIYSFKGYISGRTDDGRHPAAGLFNANGTLYGTTYYGGVGKPGDGAYPAGGLINVNGTLCGTTGSGGKRRYGTVYTLTP